MPLYRFHENNSGGSWWLNKQDYDKLLFFGWKKIPDPGYDENDMPLGSDDIPWEWRHTFGIETSSREEAVRIFELATGQNVNTSGCDCCGPPFDIVEEMP